MRGVFVLSRPGDARPRLVVIVNVFNFRIAARSEKRVSHHAEHGRSQGYVADHSGHRGGGTRMRQSQLEQER